MKHLNLLALMVFAAACAPADDPNSASTGSNAEAATVGGSPPICNTSGICYDATFGTPVYTSCRVSPGVVACDLYRSNYTMSPKPSRWCSTATDCRRVDLQQAVGTRAIAVNAGSLTAVQTWQNANCGGAIRVSNNVRTDDGAVSGTVVLSCCAGLCVTRR